MSFSRFYDDPCRVEKQLQESTGPGRYMLNVPGNGDKPCFMEDPFVRLQQWGANLRTNPVLVDSELKGLNRVHTKNDCTIAPNPAAASEAVTYPSCQPFTDQTRATNPAWTARDLEQDNFTVLPLDPQENVCLPFQNNLDTRLLERDYFLACPPVVKDNADGTMTSFKTERKL